MTSTKLHKPFVRGILWTARILLVFVLLGVLLAAIYWLGYHSYREVAEWSEAGSHESLIYDGETYYRTGKIGDKGLTKSKYPVDKIVGQVRDDGVPVTTEPATTEEPEPEEDPIDPEDTELPEETDPPVESVVPPAGAQLFEEDKHVYVLYSVKKQENFLLVLEEDGEMYLYYREGTENPLETTK